MRHIVGIILAITSLCASPYDHYFAEAGKAFGVEPSLLNRIAMIESSMNPRAVNINKNGTVDIGLMQINTIHLQRLKKVGVTKEALKDPEVNIYVAALLLSSHIRKRGYNLDAIGCYHSGNSVYKNQWLKRLAMANIPSSSTISSKDSFVSSPKNSSDDPRSRFAQQQLASRIDAKIAYGVEPKKALKEAKAEVDHLMGY